MLYVFDFRPKKCSSVNSASSSEKYSHPSLISYRLSMSLQLDKWMPHVVPSCTLKWHRIKNIGDQSHMQHQHSSLISKTTSRLIEKLNFCFSGNATEVLFHVTVMSLDTIDESSMVRISNQSQSIVRKLEKNSWVQFPT